jgi:hypothetical protein
MTHGYLRALAMYQNWVHGDHFVENNNNQTAIYHEKIIQVLGDGKQSIEKFCRSPDFTIF